MSELEGQLHARLSEVNKTVEELQSSPRQGMSEEEEQALNEKIEDLKNSYIESEAKAELAQRKIAALSYKRNELQRLFCVFFVEQSNICLVASVLRQIDDIGTFVFKLT